MAQPTPQRSSVNVLKFVAAAGPSPQSLALSAPLLDRYKQIAARRYGALGNRP